LGEVLGEFFAVVFRVRGIGGSEWMSEAQPAGTARKSTSVAIWLFLLPNRRSPSQ
jgi:hypothetical protein